MDAHMIFLLVGQAAAVAEGSRPAHTRCCGRALVETAPPVSTHEAINRPLALELRPIHTLTVDG